MIKSLLNGGMIVNATEAKNRTNVVCNGQQEIAQNLLKTKYLPQIHSAIKKACDKGLYSTCIIIKMPNLYEAKIKKCLANYFREDGYDFYTYMEKECCFNRTAYNYRISWSHNDEME